MTCPRWHRRAACTAAVRASADHPAERAPRPGRCRPGRGLWPRLLDCVLHPLVQLEPLHDLLRPNTRLVVDTVRVQVRIGTYHERPSVWRGSPAAGKTPPRQSRRTPTRCAPASRSRRTRRAAPSPGAASRTPCVRRGVVRKEHGVVGAVEHVHG